MTAPPDDTTADLHAVIAALRAERDAALAREAMLAEELAAHTAELLERKSEFDERIEYEAATVGVLKAMSASPSDTLPVFNLITRRAAELCESSTALYELREGHLYYMAGHGMDSEALAAFRQSFPRPLDRSLVVGRAILERRIIHVQNVAADTALSQVVRDLGGTTIVAIPLLRDGEPIGAIALNGRQPGGFSESQIALLQTFAEQAVIAITSAETYRALRERTAALAARNSEYGERIEQQSATIDVLKVMSGSPGDPQPVFDQIAERARSFCEAEFGAVTLVDGDHVCLQALAGTEAWVGPVRTAFPAPINTASAQGRAIFTRSAVRIADTAADPQYTLRGVVTVMRSVAVVPMLRDGVALGGIGIGRSVVGPFSDIQMELLQTFAEQAVIAISSAETYRALQTRTSDLQESLVYQTATSDVLKVISRSTFDLQPVLETVAATAARLCGTEVAAIFRRDGELWRLATSFGFPPEYEAEWRAVGAVPLDLESQGVGWRAARERRPVHIHDSAAVPGLRSGPIRQSKLRTALGVPLLREGEAVGTIVLGRQRVEPFTDRQIELVSTFADQAVIAIENTRLITEQREALEHQTATAEVLQVINASPGNLTPVLDAMLEKATRLCDAAFGDLLIYNSEAFHRAAMRGVTPAMAEFLREPIHPESEPGSALYRIVHGENILHQADITDDEVYRSGLRSRRILADLMGARTRLMVALRKEDILLGVFNIFRQEVRPFTEKQIALLQNFAAQAVIAIENARLITEQREALEQQTATAEVLQVINASPGNLTPVFDAILEKAMHLCGVAFGILDVWDGEHVRSLVTRGLPMALADWYASNRVRQPGPMAAQLLRTKRPQQHPDTMEGEGYRTGYPGPRALVDLGGARTGLVVPLLKDDTVRGWFTFFRQEVRAFSVKEIALLEGFANQAIIAMENARLLDELRQRTADLQETLEYQTATSDVLKVISRSTFDLQPVLDTVVATAKRLCDADQAMIFNFDDGMVHLTANIGFPPEYQASFDARGLTRLAPNSPGVLARAIRERRVVHVHDAAAVPGYPEAAVKLRNVRTALGVPFLREDEPIGVIVLSRKHVEPFTEQQIALVSTFADQAVIAIENTRLITEQREALEQQTATAEVLQVINASPGNLAPVFDALLTKAMHLCDVAFGTLRLYDGERFHLAASQGASPALLDFQREPLRPGPGAVRMLAGQDILNVPDIIDGEAYRSGSAAQRALVELGGARSNLAVALRRAETLLGYISVYRREVRPFTDKQIALLQNFAAQAVIAIENARLITEQREALEQQTATAEVLQVINSSPGNLAPVFDAMLEKAMRLCGAAFGLFHTYDDKWLHTVVQRGVPPAYAEYRAQNPVQIRPGSGIAQAIEARRTHNVLDLMATEAYAAGEPAVRAMVELGGVRTLLSVPLCKDDAVLGLITVYRQEVKAFSDKQIALLENFAAQAVIAMENARLLDEIRQRQEELRVTFENMGDGVAMFNETQHLVAWNRKFQDILDVPDDIIARRQTFTEYVRYFADRGEYGAGPGVEEQVRHLTEQAGHYRAYERTRPDGRVTEIRHNPVASGGFVLIISDITERKRNEVEIRAARDAAEEASRTIEAAYRDLKTAQANLIQAEKMASLGQLTAGIAHEIKNPLNFVNNFAALSVDLLSELKETAAPGFAVLSEKQRAEVEDVSAMLTSNLEKITEHGKRADGIVKAMLEHSRGSSGERRTVDLNALIDEALNLAYHGARAQDQSFNITLERDFGEGIASIEVNPQDITRVFLNLFANGFYATTKRARDGGDAGFAPTLKITTRDTGDAVEIRVRDNGIGIPADIRDKIFQPFYSTKPTGEGTGLGLSITYDIVTQQHGGTIAADSNVGEYSEFTVRLPRNP